MKIGIYGAGAVGGYLAVRLALAGHDVTCIARGAHLAAMHKNGLRLRGNGEEHVVRCLCTDDPAEAGPQDYLIVALKAHQAYDTAETMAPMLGPDTPVITAMNGVPWWYFYKMPGRFENHCLESVDPGRRQWRAIRPERAIGCVIFAAAEITEPGVIEHIFGTTFIFGEPDGAVSDRVQRLGAAIEQAGLQAPVSQNIRDEIWFKLWGNLSFNPISALTGATLVEVATDPATRVLGHRMMIEAQAIGEALAVHFREDVDKRIDRTANVGAHKTSMLQDLERGRPMEIDALVTAVQEMGRLVGIDTPYIDAVLGLIQQRGRMLGLYPTFAD